MEVALLTVKVEAAVEPNLTAVAPVKLVPVMVTEVPPAVGPEVGLTLGDGGEGRTERRRGDEHGHGAREAGRALGGGGLDGGGDTRVVGRHVAIGGGRVGEAGRGPRRWPELAMAA